MTPILTILLCVISFITAYFIGWIRGYNNIYDKQTNISNNAVCPHGHEDWDECAVCGH
jgi:hypothetical protein